MTRIVSATRIGADRLALLAPHALACPVLTIAGKPRCILFVSASNGHARATVVTGTGPDGASAWHMAMTRIEQIDAPLDWLRLDMVQAVDESSWHALRARLNRVQRNHFRLGISLDSRFEHAFLETELNANAMLCGGADSETAQVNEAAFTRYACRRHILGHVDFGDSTPLWLFSTRAVFAAEDGLVHPIAAQGRDAGRRDIAGPTPDLLRDLIAKSARYLAAQVSGDGRFVYGREPCSGREMPSYNACHHAVALQALVEAWDLTRDPLCHAAIDRAMEYLLDRLVRPAVLESGSEVAFLTGEKGEVQLGGTAACLLALISHAERTGSTQNRALMVRLAESILSMQDPGAGNFTRMLDYRSPAIQQRSRHPDEDSAAALALMRLYALTGDKRLIAAVEHACAHFIRTEYQRAPDPCLSRCLAELVRYRPEERYFRLGIDMIAAHPDTGERAASPSPALLETLLAGRDLLDRLSATPEHRHLVDMVDRAMFDRRLHRCERALMNAHFWPELAMYFPSPGEITGSFFLRNKGFRVRIDDVGQYVSSAIACRGHLVADSPESSPRPQPRQAGCALASPQPPKGFSPQFSLLDFARKVRAARDAHTADFPKNVFRDSAWDMMIELMIAHEEGRSLCMKDVMLAASETPAGAARRVDGLTEAGLVRRHADNQDQRRIHVSLTPKGHAAFAGLLRDMFSLGPVDAKAVRSRAENEYRT
ncbi:winged helix DNA-binding protein [Stakelama pacifica]|uniref:Winged helix DNA-binding protein n=1 Tax=Stakelama pacifica TaxID=517720 RepID=A0A4R6FYC9_9SPHN|nr:winged helix DNA-binding protein [Stakelama pacifica]TDN87016.1 winged helix DNA-binding protein [Stakelama pacifica]GGO91352.1 hypothetical protein GCM10011329_05890 [Stakelama pacifica]